MTSSSTDTRKRVKLYALNSERQWDDKGTGHVSSNYVERIKGVSLLVRAESDGELLLESKIHPDTAYQKQQDTLIVWSEGDNFDLALSFQEKAGCDEIWERICQVQGRDPSVEVTQEQIEESEDERYEDPIDSLPSIELPPCDINHLDDIKELTASCLASGMRKDKLSDALENENYIRKLLRVFNECEDQNNIDALHNLHDIIRNIFSLNKNPLYETMFSDELIFDVIGVLEYDPLFPEPRKYRNFLKNQPKFKEVISINNPELLSKIHQTYRVQYIHDVILPTPSVFEDNIMSCLTSFIFFNRVEIVTLIQEDERFLRELMTQLAGEKTSTSQRRDLALFLREFINFAQNLQPTAKEGFYKTLSSLGILSVLEVILSVDDQQTKNAAIDILTYIVDYTPSTVREYTLSQVNGSSDEHDLLINVIIEQMICDTDHELGHAVQLMSNLRTLIDPENMVAPNRAEKTEFLSYFYKHCIHLLIAPLLANTVEERPFRDDCQTVQLLALILDLLTFCVEHHTYHIKNTILNKDLLRRVLVLMKSSHKFLVLSALRFMRKIVASKDEFYYRYIIKGNLFKPVVDAFMENNGRYNLLDSAILEMFEFIKVDDIKMLYTYIIETYGRILESIDYVQTFKVLRLKYYQLQDKKEREKCTSLDSVPSILRTGRYRRDQRQLDEDEEMWFNEDDDYEENEPASVTATIIPSVPTSTNDTAAVLNKKLNTELESIGKSIDMKVEGSVGGGGGGNNNKFIVNSSPKICSSLNNNIAASENSINSTDQVDKNIFKRGLVDYEGDSDEEEEDEEPNDLLSCSSAAKKPRL